MTDHIYKYPRLYLNAPFTKNTQIALPEEHVHYLRNVLRKGEGDHVRVFNGADGEWISVLQDLGKKKGSLALETCIKEQPRAKAPLHLFFSPIKKQRMDFMIEKAVELGVTGLHPVIMNRTENRKINEKRMQAQIIEAAEQCERLDIPTLFPLVSLEKVLGATYDYPLYACMERDVSASLVSDVDFGRGAGFVIGPEGGFDMQECDVITKSAGVCSLYLGEEILRAETAALACLSYAKLSPVL